MTTVHRRISAGFSIRHDVALAEQAVAGGHWPDTTLADALLDAGVREPGRVVLVDGDVRLTAAELLERSRALAGAMQARMAPGSIVSFMVPNWHEAAVIYLAATHAGMVANPILPSLREHDLRFILGDAGTRMIFVPEEIRGFAIGAMVRSVADTLDDAPLVVLVRQSSGALPSLSQLEAEGAAFASSPLDPGDVRMVMYTSGTTGRPKGVLHTHNSINALIRQLGQHWLIAPGDRFLVPSPISHIGGSIYAFECPLLLGTSAVLMERWDAAEAVPVMLAERITHMAGATPFLKQLLAAAREAGTDLPDLKVFICGGASVPPALVRDAARYFARARVSRVYGSTEVPVATVGALDQRGMEEAATTDGKPGIAEVVIGEAGEIRLRGPQMLAGYVHPEDEDSAFDEAGFFRTGDQGELTPSGHLVVTGRIKDLIIRNGENIAPKEIEDLLVQHPDIDEIAIVGVPDPETGEKACAVIVPAGLAAPQVTDLAGFLAGFGVAKFKYPERVALRDTLPKNAAGKVLKHVLRNELTSI